MPNGLVLIPSQTVLSTILQGLVAQLVERNGQYQSAVYSQINVILFCDAEGWRCKDNWLSAPPAGPASSGGNTWFAPPGGVKATAALPATFTPTQCNTLAGTMIASIKTRPNITFVVNDSAQC